MIAAVFLFVLTLSPIMRTVAVRCNLYVQTNRNRHGLDLA